jgi:hypothetical protein
MALLIFVSSSGQKLEPKKLYFFREVPKTFFGPYLMIFSFKKLIFQWIT